MDALAESYKPGRTFAQAFADFYAKVFAAQGLLILDAGGRDIHRMGAPVLRAGIERADELHAALVDRSHELEAAGYHAQVAVRRRSRAFCFSSTTHTRCAGRAQAAGRRRRGTGRRVAGGAQTYSTSGSLAFLKPEPERISPSALLRPVFQDFLLSTSLTIGGPAEMAYFAQSAVLFERFSAA